MQRLQFESTEDFPALMPPTGGSFWKMKPIADKDRQKNVLNSTLDALKDEISCGIS